MFINEFRKSKKPLAKDINSPSSFIPDNLLGTCPTLAEYEPPAPATALFLGLKSHRNKTINALLNKEISCDITDSNGNTALHLATEQGAHKIAGLLLEQGATTTCQNQLGQTPAHLAVINDEYHILKLLIEQQKFSCFFILDNDGYAPIKYLVPSQINFQHTKKLLQKVNGLELPIEPGSKMHLTKHSHSKLHRRLSLNMRKESHFPKKRRFSDPPQYFDFLDINSDTPTLSLDDEKSLTPIQHATNQALVNAGLHNFLVHAQSSPMEVTTGPLLLEKFIFCEQADPDDSDSNLKLRVTVDKLTHLAYGINSIMPINEAIEYIALKFNQAALINQLAGVYFIKELINADQHNEYIASSIFQATLDKIFDELIKTPATQQVITHVAQLLNKKIEHNSDLQKTLIEINNAQQSSTVATLENLKIKEDFNQTTKSQNISQAIADDIMFIDAEAMWQVHTKDIFSYKPQSAKQKRETNDSISSESKNNFSQLAKNNNRLFSMVIYDLLMSDNAEQDKLWDLYFTIAKKLLSGNDFIEKDLSSFTAITCAFLSQPINRLHLAEFFAGATSNKELSHFRELISPKANYNQLRKMISLNSVPPFHIISTDIVHTKDNKNLEAKTFGLGKIIYDFKNQQQNCSNYLEHYQIKTNIIERLNKIGHLSEDKLLKLSYNLVPNIIDLSSASLLKVKMALENDFPFVVKVDKQQLHGTEAIDALNQWNEQKEAEAQNVLLSAQRKVDAHHNLNTLCHQLKNSLTIPEPIAESPSPGSPLLNCFAQINKSSRPNSPSLADSRLDHKVSSPVTYSC